MKRIPIAKPWLGEAENAAILEPLADGYVVQGPRVAAFERAIAEFTGAPFAVACTSCTTALHLALAELGVGPGDEVLVPALTWVSTANAVRFCGATPVFCDIDLSTFNVDVADLEARITPKTRALLPVHLFGRPAPMAALMGLAEAYDLSVVEDAACGLGAFVGDQHVGLDGAAGCLSFHPRKNITTGEGGMVLCTDADRAARLRSLRDHGASVSGTARTEVSAAQMPDFEVMGFNYRMTDLQGALGVAQAARLPEALARRARLAERYAEGLAEVPGLVLPCVGAGERHAWQAYVCLYAPEAPTLERLEVLGAGRDAVMQGLSDQGIATRPGTHAVHALGLYRRLYGLSPEDRPWAWMAERLSIALPLYPTLEEADQDRVIEAIKGLMGGEGPAVGPGDG